MNLTSPYKVSLLLFSVLSVSAAYAEITDEQEAKAQELLARNGVEVEDRFLITRYLEYKNGGGMISVQQLHEGLPVFDSELAFHFIDGGELVRTEDGSAKLLGIGQEVDDLVVDRDQLISEQEADELFAAGAKTVTIPSMTGRGQGSVIPGPECAQDPESVEATLGIYTQKVVWRVWCRERRSPMMYVDAITGSRLLFDSGIRS